MKVTLTAPVMLRGVLLGPGDTPDVDAKCAERWESKGWIEKASAPTEAKAEEPELPKAPTPVASATEEPSAPKRSRKRRKNSGDGSSAS
jgi:hypothetical protein